jgi:hypothetical protein
MLFFDCWLRVKSILLKWSCPDDVAFSGTSLAYLREQCQSLMTLSLVNLKSLQEDQIRILGAF